MDPVIDATIDKLIAREHARLLKLKNRLLDQCKVFEKRYSLKSAVFYTRYEKGEMGDQMDFVEWAATWEMIGNIGKRLELLEVNPDE